MIFPFFNSPALPENLTNYSVNILVAATTAPAGFLGKLHEAATRNVDRHWLSR
jgi:hypothetical protein